PWGHQGPPLHRDHGAGAGQVRQGRDRQRRRLGPDHPAAGRLPAEIAARRGPAAGRNAHAPRRQPVGGRPMNRRYLTLGIVALGVLVVLANTLFVVEQRQQAIVLRFGEPVRVINQPGSPSPGLKAKVPFLENVIKLDKRNLALEAEQEEIISADQERLVVDAFVRYRINDPLQYYRTLRNEQTASDRIERLVNSALRQVLGTATSNEIISGRRGQLMADTRKDVAQRAAASRLGIQIIDVRIKRADLPKANQA